ncbi:hypothetical protein [Nocardia rhamnosiphila]|uniref:Uncharacterized protein n=1 Tax=Nocardia rhamnosiphila TaxID=426716 RepID=A0ABV2WIZ4_9NOCA
MPAVRELDESAGDVVEVDGVLTVKIIEVDLVQRRSTPSAGACPCTPPREMTDDVTATHARNAAVSGSYS